MNLKFITKPNFGRWLKKQKKHRLFDLGDGDSDAKLGCPMCNFIREHRLMAVFEMGTMELFQRDEKNHLATVCRFPKWFTNFFFKAVRASDRNLIAAGELKKLWK